METMVLPARDDQLQPLNDRLEELLTERGCPMRTVLQIQLSVEEIFVNVAHYAYAPGTGDVQIDLLFSENPSAVQISFSDRGMPFDPLAKQDADVSLTADERQIGGLGIFLVKKNMDTVSYEYRDGANCLTVTKSW